MVIIVNDVELNYNFDKIQITTIDNKCIKRPNPTHHSVVYKLKNTLRKVYSKTILKTKTIKYFIFINYNKLLKCN